MTSYLLDTSVIIDYLRGKKEIVSLLNNLDGEICSSSICLAELYEGVYRVKEPKKAEEIVLNFFASLSVVYNVDQTVARQFGQIRAQLKTSGQIIEDLDLLIAATCLANDLSLVTLNTKHFSHVGNLEMYPIYG